MQTILYAKQITIVDFSHRYTPSKTVEANFLGQAAI